MCRHQIREGAGGSTGAQLWLPVSMFIETAVAMFRRRMRYDLARVAPWKETPQQWATRAKVAVKAANKEYELQALCNEFPTRLRALVDNHGRRLKK